MFTPKGKDPSRNGQNKTGDVESPVASGSPVFCYEARFFDFELFRTVDFLERCADRRATRLVVVQRARDPRTSMWANGPCDPVEW
jgi:hypothetical protein